MENSNQRMAQIKPDLTKKNIKTEVSKEKTAQTITSENSKFAKLIQFINHEGNNTKSSEIKKLELVKNRLKLVNDKKEKNIPILGASVPNLFIQPETKQLVKHIKKNLHLLQHTINQTKNLKNAVKQESTLREINIKRKDISEPEEKHPEDPKTVDNKGSEMSLLKDSSVSPKELLKPVVQLRGELDTTTADKISTIIKERLQVNTGGNDQFQIRLAIRPENLGRITINVNYNRETNELQVQMGGNKEALELFTKHEATVNEGIKETGSLFAGIKYIKDKQNEQQQKEREKHKKKREQMQKKIKQFYL